MKTKIWMPWYGADYLNDTQRLELHEHGAYMLLLWQFWCSKGQLKYSDKAFARMLGISVDRWVNEIKPALEPFFQIEGDVWTHKRVAVESVKASLNRENRAAYGKLGGRPKKPQGLPQGNAEVNHMGKVNVTPSPSPSDVHTHTPAAQPGESGEREPDFNECGWPDWKEWWAYCQLIGMVAEWRARDEWDKQESRQWDGIQRWQSHANRVNGWWKRDGAPMKDPRAGQARAPGRGYVAPTGKDHPDHVPPTKAWDPADMLTDEERELKRLRIAGLPLPPGAVDMRKNPNHLHNLMREADGEDGILARSKKCKEDNDKAL
jgi:uncharacterized protein YdaU (DUF1376 family)